MSSVKLKDGYFFDEFFDFFDLLNSKYWDYRVTEFGNWEAISRNKKVELFECGGKITAIINEDSCNVMKFDISNFIDKDTAKIIMDAAKEDNNEQE